MTPEERTELLQLMESRFATREEINARFDSMESRFATREEMNARFDEVPTRAEINARFDEMPTREEMNARFEEMLRRQDVLFESTQDMFRQLAEGQMALSERMERMGAELRKELAETRTDLTALISASYTDLDRRVRRLEERG